MRNQMERIAFKSVGAANAKKKLEIEKLQETIEELQKELAAARVLTTSLGKRGADTEVALAETERRRQIVEEQLFLSEAQIRELRAAARDSSARLRQLEEATRDLEDVVHATVDAVPPTSCEGKDNAGPQPQSSLPMDPQSSDSSERETSLAFEICSNGTCSNVDNDVNVAVNVGDNVRENNRDNKNETEIVGDVTGNEKRERKERKWNLVHNCVSYEDSWRLVTQCQISTGECKEVWSHTEVYRSFQERPIPGRRITSQILTPQLERCRSSPTAAVGPWIE